MDAKRLLLALGSVDIQHMSATGVILDAAQGAPVLGRGGPNPSSGTVWSFQTSDEQRRDAPKLSPVPSGCLQMR